MKLALIASLVVATSSAIAEGTFVGGGNLFGNSVDNCAAAACGSVEIEFDIDNNFQPFNTELDTAGEAFFNPNLGGYFFDQYVTNLGVAYLDRDEIAAKYTDAGFYLLTRSFENGVLPKADTITVSNVQFVYNSFTSSVQLSFDWESSVSTSIANLQYALYMNYDANLTDHLSYWQVEGESRTTQQRRIVVQSTESLDRIDVHAIIDGAEYNFQMTEAYQNFYVWDFPPTVPDNSDMSIFFNYTVQGLGVDTPRFETNLDDLQEIYEVQISTLNIAMTDQVIYDLLGDLGFDPIKIETSLCNVQSKRRAIDGLPHEP